MKWKEEGENGLLQDTFVEAQFKYFQFNIKATSRIFQDEQRLNYACLKVTPVTNYEKENR